MDRRIFLVLILVFLKRSSANSLKRSLSHFDENSDYEKLTCGCGYEQCDLGHPDMINVHLIPHTHDDAGWLRTVDDYYYNTVQYIFDSVNYELQADPKKKFIYVEMAFFYRWWNEQLDDMKLAIKKLVDRGQLEFILGGWSMNDEATTHYSSIIDQHTIGFKFLLDTFGKCGIPKIGWQIDPFGHSREQASIFAQFGFDGLFFSRLDYQDYNQRKQTKTLEHMWFASSSLGDQASLFTGALYEMSYSPPLGFCFECGTALIKDNPTLDDYNANDVLANFITYVEEQAKYYTTNHQMWTMGSDFQYSNARINYKNLDKLIKLVQKSNQSKINVIYSTPACYLYALNQANLTYTSKNDDFFPYAHQENTFWTGYFTSRPNLKGYERTTNNILQVCKQLHALTQLRDENSAADKINFLKQAMGVLQHHDAVSGTSKQHVAYNYAKMLSKGINECQDVIRLSLSKLMNKSAIDSIEDFQFCNLLNVSNCAFTEKTENFAVVVYNPFSQPINQYVKIPVTSSAYKVLNDSLEPVEMQFVPVSDETKKLAEYLGSKSQFELTFSVQLPPLGYATYFVSKLNESYADALDSMYNTGNIDDNVKVDAADYILENEFLKLTFSEKTGLLSEIENKESKIKIKAVQSLKYYLSKTDGMSQASGAYVFRPDGNVRDFIEEGKVKAYYVKGPLVNEVHQVFSDWTSQVFRLKKGAKHFEVEWTVGPIPAGDYIGKEVISSFETSINNSDTFYTDANGREMIKRVRDYRPTWNFQNTEPEAGNFFPVNSRIYIQDPSKNVQLTIMTDRSQGGSSLRNGQLELMVHRRLFHDDGLGVIEPLNEPGIDGKGIVARGTHYILLDTINSSVAQHRSMAQQIYMAPYLAFVDLKQTSPDQFVKSHNTQWSGLKKVVNENVHILTLEDWNNGEVLVRLEHYYEKDEHAELSQPAVISLKDLFAPLKISSFEERTLGANQQLKGVQRLQWNVQGYGRTKSDMSSFYTPVNMSTWDVELKPMQIRTFILKLSK